MNIASLRTPTAQPQPAAGAPVRVPAGTAPPAPAPGAATERPVLFACEGEQLLGVLHEAAGELGVVVVVGGPQVRAGSHRLFVHLARTLAIAGHPVLRFDVRGMGDSSGAQRTFEQITPDIGAAIDALMAAQPQLRGVVLWGLCDGASAALLYLHECGGDARVQGLCLLNPWVRSEQTLAQVRVRHYYWRRLGQPTFWLKLLRGQVGASAGSGLLRQLLQSRNQRNEGQPASGFQQRMLKAWQRFNAPVLLLLSENDLTAQEFQRHALQTPGWLEGAGAAHLQTRQVTGADHTFSRPERAADMVRSAVDWLARLGVTAPGDR